MRNHISILITHLIAALAGAGFMFLCFVIALSGGVDVKSASGKEFLCIPLSD